MKRILAGILDKVLLLIFIVIIVVYGFFFLFTLTRTEISDNYKVDIIISLVTFLSLFPFLKLCQIYLTKFSKIEGLDKVDMWEIGLRIPFIKTFFTQIKNPLLVKLISKTLIALLVVGMYIVILRFTHYNPIEQIKDLSTQVYTFEGIIEEKREKERWVSRRNKVKEYFIVIDYVEFQIDLDTYSDSNVGDYIKIKYLPNSQLIVGEIELVKKTYEEEQGTEDEQQPPLIDQSEIEETLEMENVVSFSCKNNICDVTYEDGTTEVVDMNE